MKEFITVYRLYRNHGRMYALKTAWRIAIQGVPF
jgi:hypothetical protein